MLCPESRCASTKARTAIAVAIEGDADNRVTDLHIWRVGPRHLAAVVSLVTHEPRDPDHYKKLLAPFHDLVHVTIEVHPCTDGEKSEPPSKRHRSSLPSPA